MTAPPYLPSKSSLPSEQQVRNARRFMWSVTGLMALLSAAMLSEFVVGWQTVTATVVEIDSPRSCREDGHLLFGPRQRDWAPRHPGYCGLVRTDQGSFQLPESNRLFFGSWTRESRHDALREGCRFELRVFGSGYDLGPGELPSNRNKTLWSAEPIGPCLAEGSAP